MHWTRRRSKWPFLAALGCLLALTLAAPWSWQRPRTGGPLAAPVLAPAPRPRTGSIRHLASSEREVPAIKFVSRIPALPPLTASEPEPALAGPMVIADDYVAVAEPLFEASEPPTAPAPLEPEVEPASAESELAAPDGPPLLRPQGRSVLVRSAPAPTVVAPPVVTVESLIKVRDALRAVVDQLREMPWQSSQQEATRQAPPQTSPLRVMVDSQDDRLAMIPPDWRLSAADESAPTLAEPAAVEDAPAPTLAAPQADPTPAVVVEQPPQPAPESAPAPPQAPPMLRYRPAALIAQLETLENIAPAAPWAQQVKARVERLASAPASDGGQGVVAELNSLAQQGYGEALEVSDAADQSAWIRTTRALDRRIPAWTLLADPAYTDSALAETRPDDNAGLMLHALHDVASLVSGSPEGEAWRGYLRVDDLAGLTSVAGGDYLEVRRATARDVLARIADRWLTHQQQEFLAQPPIAALAEQLRPWASGDASVDALAALIERFEATGSLRDADAIAELRLRMQWSDDPRLQSLAQELNRHYRNANVRIAFSGELMNRMIPPQAPAVAPVNGQIAGAAVRGHSETETTLRVRLLPDPFVWRIGLEAHGQVNSRTRSDTWPARLRNASKVDYEARKLVMINRYGMHVWPAEANADGNTSLLGVESTFRAVPIVGALIESAAREQHRLSRPTAVAQIRDKVTKQAREQMDAEANAKLANLDQRFRESVIEPLTRFALAPEPVDMNTTAERATMRVRLASEPQLAAHTPRPSAPSDSLASFQLHQSVFNNGLRALELDGQRMTVGELHGKLSAKIRRHAEAPPADLPRAAKVEFAKSDAVRIACNGDRIELILNIVELRHGRDSIRGVGVHAFFKPVIDGLEVKLVRDGTLQFRGAHLRTGPRMVLHSVFGKLLPKDQEVPVLAAKLGDDPRFSGLMITQLVIDDGWIALAMGPAHPDRTAWRTRGVELR